MQCITLKFKIHHNTNWLQSWKISKCKSERTAVTEQIFTEFTKDLAFDCEFVKNMEGDTRITAQNYGCHKT